MPLDAVIHAPNRLQICAFLAPLDKAEFRVLREELGVSDSVLSKHLKQLEQAGYIVQDKVPKAGRNRTWIGLTDSGRVAFEKYVAQLKRLVAMAESGAPQGLG